MSLEQSTKENAMMNTTTPPPDGAWTIEQLLAGEAVSYTHLTLPTIYSV